jgi:elongation factor G
MIIKFLPSPLFVGETLGFNPNNENELIARNPDVNDPFTAFVYKTRIDQYAGKFSYFRVRSGKAIPDMELTNASTENKVKLSHIYSIMGSKQVEVNELIAGDIGVATKLDNVSTADTLHDPKHPIKLPPLKLPKTVYHLSVRSENKGDEDKIMASLNKVTQEDPTFKVKVNPETKETIISGMGEIQLDVIKSHIQDKNNLKIITNIPKIAYRETISKAAKAQYRHKKQTGGHGQFGEVFINVEPLERGLGFEFVNKIVGGAIPKGYILGVEKGLKEAMEEGVLAKYPITDVKVTLYDGSFHPVDSSELSFKLAALHAMKKAVNSCDPILLEPIMNVTVYTDKELTGDVLGDIQGRRGRILGMDEGAKSTNQVIKAQVPFSGMTKYSIELRSLTSGRATFEMGFSHYEPLTGRLADKVIQDAKDKVTA